MKKLIYVRITGNMINEAFQARSHEIVPFPANTYHKFEMPDGTTVYYNDFGIRSLIISDTPGKLV